MDIGIYMGVSLDRRHSLLEMWTAAEVVGWISAAAGFHMSFCKASVPWAWIEAGCRRDCTEPSKGSWV